MTQTKTQPIIGIAPSFDDGTVIPGKPIDRIFLRRDYTQILAAVGATPLILNPDMSLMSIIALCDGIIISGGEDIDPSRYGAQRFPQTRRTEPAERFEWETELIEACDEAHTPILGICYGMQRLNVHYGGTLIQDIPTYLPENIGHDNTLHTVTFEHEFLGMKEKGIHEINSRHHQAVEYLADGFTACAVAPDGIVEAIEGRGHYGMQWHPESDETGAHVYRVFIEKCMEKKAALDQPQL